MTAVYDLLGHRVSVTVFDATVGGACRSMLASFEVDATAADTAVPYVVVHADDRWHVESDGQRLYSATDPRAALAFLEARLVTEALKHRPDLFHVHGAALAPPTLDGAVVLAGAARVGKTTLARALMDRGFLPFGDDVTMIDSTSLEVQPFPRAFHLRESDGDMPTYVQPRRSAHVPLPVKLIVFLTRDVEGEPRAEPVGWADAASSLLRQSGSLAASPATALAVGVRLISRAPCYRLELGSPSASAAAVEALCTGWRSRPLEATV